MGNAHYDHNPGGAEFDPGNMHPAQPAMDWHEAMFELKNTIQHALGIDPPRRWRMRRHAAWRAMRRQAEFLEDVIAGSGGGIRADGTMWVRIVSQSIDTIDPEIEIRELWAMMEACR